MSVYSPTVDIVDADGRARKAFEVNVDDVARLFGISSAEVRAWCRSGELAALPRDTTNDTWRIPAAAVYQLAEARAEEARRAARRLRQGAPR